MSLVHSAPIPRFGLHKGNTRLEPTEAPAGSRGLSFLLFIASLVVTIFLAGILFTYDKLDKGFSHSSSMTEVHNIFGTPGAWTADLLYLLFGWGAWLFVIGSFVLLIKSWIAFAKPAKKASTPNVIRLIMFCVLVISVCTLLFLRFHSYSASLPGTAGGALGSALGTEFLHWTDLTWSSLICVVLAIFTAPFALCFSWISIAEGIGKGIDSVFSAAKNRKQLAEDKKVGAQSVKDREKSPTDEQTLPEDKPINIGQPVTPNPVTPAPDPNNPWSDNSPLPIPDSERPKVGNQDDTDGPDLEPIGETGDETEEPPELVPEPPAPPEVIKPEFILPDSDLLDPIPFNRQQEDQAAMQIIADRIEQIYSEYGIKVKVLDWTPGPIITLFKVQPAPGITSKRIINYSKDVARGLGLDRIRIIENMREVGCIGLEIPNPPEFVQTIRLKEVIASAAFMDNPSRLTLALGKNTVGEPRVIDLTKAPHLLVAGTTGSGKSVGVNAMIMSMLYKNTPDELRLILIDPKTVEFSQYENIPYLLTPVITDMKQASTALGWAVREMERRFELMRAVSVRNFNDFNEKLDVAEKAGTPIMDPSSPENPQPLKKFCYIVIIIDELADLILTNRKEVENLIMRLTQKARAAGMHMILATQRPSVDIVTPIIKTNCPSRISFQVANRYDSSTIINESGAEELLGNGDMFYMSPGRPLQRIHGAFVSDKEIKEVTNHAKAQWEPEYVDAVTVSPEEVPDEATGDEVKPLGPSVETDVFYKQAVDIVVNEQKASISYLQRRLGIGYNRAAKLIEAMEANGIVSPPAANGKRTILVASSN